MLTVILVMTSGIAAGWLLRRRRIRIQGVITLLIWLLLFLLGAEVGGNRRIIAGIYSLGLEAVAITLAAVIGSCLMAWALWTVISRRTREKE